jgi:predicted  nucleic acid-binding Zn-ribbon protein
MAVRLRRQFLKLLDEDKEFRYTVAGYLGLGEILKRLDSIEENIRKIWEEIRGLREGQEKLWKAQNRLWEEVKALREGQEKLWEEVKLLREGQNKLWEGQNRLWEEVKALREGQEKLWASHRRLENYMRSAFGELRTALGVTYEMHAAA